MVTQSREDAVDAALIPVLLTLKSEARFPHEVVQMTCLTLDVVADVLTELVVRQLAIEAMTDMYEPTYRGRCWIAAAEAWNVDRPGPLQQLSEIGEAFGGQPDEQARNMYGRLAAGPATVQREFAEWVRSLAMIEEERRVAFSLDYAPGAPMTESALVRLARLAVPHGQHVAGLLVDAELAAKVAALHRDELDAKGWRIVIQRRTGLCESATQWTLTPEPPRIPATDSTELATLADAELPEAPHAVRMFTKEEGDLLWVRPGEQWRSRRLVRARCSAVIRQARRPLPSPTVDEALLEAAQLDDTLHRLLRAVMLPVPAIPDTGGPLPDLMGAMEVVIWAELVTSLYSDGEVLQGEALRSAPAWIREFCTVNRVVIPPGATRTRVQSQGERSRDEISALADEWCWPDDQVDALMYAFQAAQGVASPETAIGALQPGDRELVGWPKLSSSWDVGPNGKVSPARCAAVLAGPVRHPLRWPAMQELARQQFGQEIVPARGVRVAPPAPIKLGGEGGHGPESFAGLRGPESFPGLHASAQGFGIVVRCCDDCPFATAAIMSDDCYSCGHPAKEGETVDDPNAAPPSWCPLQSRPAIVALDQRVKNARRG